MCDDLCMRLREKGQKTSVVSLSIGYSMEVYGGFSHQIGLDIPTDDTEIILSNMLKIYDKYIENYPIRRVYLSLGKLSDGKEIQLSLFEDEEEAEKRRNLQKITDELKTRYGKDIVLRGSALLKESTAKERHKQIGGHKK